MSAAEVARVRQLYEGFNTGQVTPVLSLYAHGAVYVQTDTDRIVKGQLRIREIIFSWHTCFGDDAYVDLDELVTNADPRRLTEVPGSSFCAQVDFELCNAYYVKTFPGLERIAPAHNREVHLRVGETVWLNADGLVIRLENAMGVNALRSLH